MTISHFYSYYENFTQRKKSCENNEKKKALPFFKVKFAHLLQPGKKFRSKPRLYFLLNSIVKAIIMRRKLTCIFEIKTEKATYYRSIAISG